MASLPIVDKWMSELSNYKINKAGGELCGKAPCILLLYTLFICRCVSTSYCGALLQVWHYSVTVTPDHVTLSLSPLMALQRQSLSRHLMSNTHHVE